jgi:putative hydrolase of HD superfamily
MNLESQLAFIREIDKLKHVIRQTILLDGSRKENTAEHSWHVAITAMTLAKYADESVDILRVIKLLLVHDIVEIDAGDTFAFDEVGYEDNFEREEQAADRIFGILPDEQADEFNALWHEFEYAETPDSKFANALDQIMPVMHNIWREGNGSWQDHAPAFEKVYERCKTRVGDASDDLWFYLRDKLDEALAKGWLKKDER